MQYLHIFLFFLFLLSNSSFGLVRVFKLIPNVESTIRTDCIDAGGQLAVIEDEETNMQAFQAARMQSALPYLRVRLGAQIFRADEGFSWVDGGRIVYSNWARNQPDNYRGRNETCVEMIITDTEEQGKWNDQLCDVIPTALCELETRYKYKIFRNNYKTLVPLCYANAGRLAEIRSREDQELALRVGMEARTMGERKLLIGARLVSPIYSNRQQYERKFVWPNEILMSYSHWSPGEPNNGKKNESCVEFQLNAFSRWNDVNCEKPYLALCRISPTNITLVRNKPEAIREKCLLPGGRLMAIRSTKDQADASLIIRGNREKMRLRNAFTDKNVDYGSVLLGARRIDAFSCPEHIFAWVLDEVPLSYTNWSPGEPIPDRKKSCVEMKVTENGNWNTVNCGAPELALCQYPEVPAPYVTYEVITEEGADYLREYRFWEQQCRHSGGSLARIMNETEQLYAEKAVRRKRLDASEKVMIGATQSIYTRGSFEWLDGSPIVYSQWINETKNFDYDCVSMVTAGPNLGKWRIVECRARNALCQYHPET